MPASRHILVSGASGFIGLALLPALRAAGHHVIPLRRTPSASPAPGEASWDIEQGQVRLQQVPAPDAVIHLAGESVAQRWTPSSQRRMRSSRCEGTRVLSAALARLSQPPRVLLCASAIGYYGDRGADWIDETCGRGQGFLAELVEDWEAGAQAAREAGLRVVQLRLGIVLDRAGGALARMLPVFRLGLAGRLGDGQQYWSWITRFDAVRALMHALDCAALDGPVNLVAPHPVRNVDFTKALGAALRRPTCLTVPRLLIEGVFGQMGQEMFLSSCRVRPARLLASGFSFHHSELAPALGELLGPARS